MTDAPYGLEEVVISGFRAYLVAKTFDFSTKRSLAVFAPNGSGKSSLVDALEFLFSAEGTLERIGLRTVNNNAGVTALAHNLAAERKIQSFVSASFKQKGKAEQALRNASGSERSRPVLVAAVNAKFVVNPLIRGHELRRFVEAQSAEKRYEDVARWLQLEPLVDIQRHLRGLRQRTKAAADDASGVRRVDSQLAKKTTNAIKEWDDAAVIAYANEQLAPLDPALLIGALSPADAGFVAVAARAKSEEQELGLEGLRQIRRMAAGVFEQGVGPEEEIGVETGLIPDFEAAYRTQTGAASAEATERAAAADVVFAELWRIAEPIFSEGQPTLADCPICTTPLAAGAAGSFEGVRVHLGRRRRELARYSKAKKALTDAGIAVKNAKAQLLTALKALSPVLAQEHAAEQKLLASYAAELDAWTVGTAPDATKVIASLKGLTSVLDANISQIESRQGDSTYAKALAKLETLVELREERLLAVRTQAELGAILIALNTQATFITHEIRAKVQVLLDTIQEPVNRLYRAIQGPSAVRIKLELPSEDDTNQQRLNLVIDFAANRTGVQPGGYLSDSQIHSLALALRLAAIQKFNGGAPILALDDIVTSYDADHRRAIAALLATEFTGFQLIVTTHDERFFVYLKDQLGDKAWHFTRIVRRDPDFGPRFVDHKITDVMVETRWQDGDSAANEMRQAEEEWLLGLCRDFGVDVRIRSVDRAYSYERSELASALAGFLNSQGLVPPLAPGVNNRFLTSLQLGAVENFGSHFQDGPYGDGSLGDERTRWMEFSTFRAAFVCTKCGRKRFKRPVGMAGAVCAASGCEAQFAFPAGVN